MLTLTHAMPVRRPATPPQAYTRALDIDAENGDYFNKRGEVYQQLGEHDKVTTMHTLHSCPLEHGTWCVRVPLAPSPRSRHNPRRSMRMTSSLQGEYRADGRVHTPSRDAPPVPPAAARQLHFSCDES